MQKQTVCLLLLLTGISAMKMCPRAQGNPNFGDAWTWQLPPRQYGLLSQDVRNQFSRAEKLLQDGHYKAAAVEFEKMLAQHERSSARPHALLLQGYSLHLDRKRNTAIAKYTELLDFYAESVDQAVPAYFLMGWAQRENGHTEQAIETWEALAENDHYHTHPLTDRTLLILAAHYAGKDEPRKAEQALSLVVELYVNAFVRPQSSAVEAHKLLTQMYVQEGRSPALDSLLDQSVPYIERHADRRARADYVFTIASPLLGRVNERNKRQFFNWFRDQQPHYEKARALQDYFAKTTHLTQAINAQEDWRAFISRWIDFAAEQRPDALSTAAGLLITRLGTAAQAQWKLDHEWTRLMEMLMDALGRVNTGGQLHIMQGVFGAMRRSGLTEGAPPWKTLIDWTLSREEQFTPDAQIRLYQAGLGSLDRASLQDGSREAVFWDTLIARLATLYTKMLNPERDQGLVGIVDRLILAERYDHANRIATQIEQKALSMTKQLDILLAQEQYADAAALCEEIETLDTGKYAEMALKKRVELYHRHLSRYEDAIVLYQMINDPPKTDWSIVDCYERMSKFSEAVALCTQIENFFPDQASKAAYHIAMVWHRANDRQRAIAAFRSVLRKYPKSRESVQAHQMQEHYGFDFGGGVTEEMK